MSTEEADYDGREEDIPVNDVELVQMLKRTQELCRIKPTPLLVEPPLSLQVVEQLAAVHERQDQVELLGVLERKLERDDERVVDLREDGPFGERVRDFGPRHDVRLADRLERVDPTRVLLADLHDLPIRSPRESTARKNVTDTLETYLAKRALADNLEQVKVVDGEVLRLIPNWPSLSATSKKTAS